MSCILQSHADRQLYQFINVVRHRIAAKVKYPAVYASEAEAATDPKKMVSAGERASEASDASSVCSGGPMRSAKRGVWCPELDALSGVKTPALRLDDGLTDR